MSNLQHGDPKLKPGSGRCKCAECGRYFGGVRAFDLHRVGPANARSCADPARLTGNSGRTLLRLNDRGFWVRDYER